MLYDIIKDVDDPFRKNTDGEYIIVKVDPTNLTKYTIHVKHFLSICKDDEITKNIKSFIDELSKYSHFLRKPQRYVNGNVVGEDGMVCYSPSEVGPALINQYSDICNSIIDYCR